MEHHSIMFAAFLLVLHAAMRHAYDQGHAAALDAALQNGL